MEAQDLRNLINKRNNEMMYVWDAKVDKFVEQFYNAISSAYDNGKGGKYAGCKHVGISIHDVDLERLESISFKANEWILAGSETFHEGYNFPTYWEFIDKKTCEEISMLSISGACAYEIYDELRYLVTELEKRGFECYVDTGNFYLIVAFDL